MNEKFFKNSFKRLPIQIIFKEALPISYTANDLAQHAYAERLEQQEGHFEKGDDFNRRIELLQR